MFRPQPQPPAPKRIVMNSTMVGERQRTMMRREVGTAALGAFATTVAGITTVVAAATGQFAVAAGMGGVTLASGRGTVERTRVANGHAVRSLALDTLVSGQTGAGKLYGRAPTAARSPDPVPMPKSPGDRALFNEKFAQRLASGDQAVGSADVLNRAAMNTTETGFQMHPSAAAIFDRAAAALGSRTRIQAENAPASEKAAADARVGASLALATLPAVLDPASKAPATSTKVGDHMRSRGDANQVKGALLFGAGAAVGTALSGTGVGAVLGYGITAAATVGGMGLYKKGSIDKARAPAIDNMVRGQTQLGALYGRDKLVAAGRAYLNDAAERKAQAAPAPTPAAPAAAPAAGTESGTGRTGYTTIDGRTVEATAAQAQAWSNRRK